MYTIHTPLIYLTDSQRLPTNRGLTMEEPTPGSVVLVMGPTGTAWQRYFTTGEWHRCGGGRPRSWGWLLRQKNLVLAYSAPERV